MAVLAAGGIGIVQHVAYQGRPVAAVGAVAGTAIPEFRRIVGVFGSHRCQRVTAQAERLVLLDQQVGIG